MTTRCYSLTRHRIPLAIGFVVIVILVAVFVHSWLGVGQSPAEPWLIRSSTPAAPTASTTAISLMHQLQPSSGTGILVESERVRPFETPPSDISPDAGSVGQDGTKRMAANHLSSKRRLAAWPPPSPLDRPQFGLLQLHRRCPGMGWVSMSSASSVNAISSINT
uniref:Uncharacterized protein n=1 Tax=Anopheles albimanus TaxID=7167 RepID=A0A182F7T6_ANOAL